MGDGHPFDQQQENSIGEDGQRLVTSEDYEVRVIEPAQPGGNWEAKAAIKMHMTENALTVRIVSIKVRVSLAHDGSIQISAYSVSRSPKLITLSLISLLL